MKIKNLNFSTSDYYRKLQTSVLLLLLTCFAFVFVPYIVADVNAETAEIALDWTKVILELDTGSNSGNVDFNSGNAITPNDTGVLSAEAKTLTVNTTGKHFNVYLSMDSSVNNKNILCYDFDASDSEKDKCVHTNMGISPVSEDNGNPAPLTGEDRVNSWGYALNDDDGSLGFSAAGTYINSNLSGDSVITANASNSADLALYNAKFAAVPTFGNEDLIWSANTTNNNGFGTNTVNGRELTGDSNNTKQIIYGVSVNNNLVAGTYGSKILYTAVASASDINTPSTNIVSSLTLGGPSDVTKLYMDLDAQGAEIKPSDISVKLVKHSTAKSVDLATATASDPTKTSGDGKIDAAEYESLLSSVEPANCLVVSNSVTLGEGNLSFSCVLPELGLNEGTDYDFIVEFPVSGGLTRHYVSYKTDNDNVGSIRYVGLQTKDSNDNYYVDTMQGITAGICSMTNTWGTGIGDDATLYNRTGTGTALAASGTAGLEIGLGTFQLKDNRDNKTYLVRRLADGNCWMVQNLDLNLADFVGTENLTSANTDLNSKSVWDPGASLTTKAQTAIDAGSPAGSMTSLQTQLKTLLGDASACTEQFQNYGNYDLGCFWGSKLSTDGNWTELSTTTDNANAEMPRSYDNSADWINNDGGYINSANTGSDGATSKLNTTGTPSSTVGDNAETQYIGDYYNWYAATAESGAYSMTSGNARDSICPSNWQLPVNSGDKSWYNLLTTNYYTANKTEVDIVSAATSSSYTTDSINSSGGSRMFRSYPLSLIFSGNYYWVTGKLNDRGTYGSYWTSTAIETGPTRVYYLSNLTYPQNRNAKAAGFALRCIARDDDATTVEEETASTCAAGKICYDGNGGTGTMSDQSASASTDVMLTAPTFQKLGYAFVGWNTQENGFGTTYQANETITTPSSLSSEGLKLYAKWLPSSGTMQDFTAIQCDNLGLHQTVALTDSRDGKAYAIRKMKDGNCWMVNNLNLELADFAGTHNLTNDNTDLNSKSYWDPSESTVTKYTSTYASELESRGLEKNFTGLSELLLGQTQPAQLQSEDQIGYWWGSKVSDDGSLTALDTYESNANSEIPRSYTKNDTTYYNWYAATAESGTYAMTSGNAEDSICPAGWQLPVSSSSDNGNDNYTDKSWTKLMKSTSNGYGLWTTSGGITDKTIILALVQQPLALTYSGYYSTGYGTVNSFGTSGFYHIAVAMDKSTSPQGASTNRMRLSRSDNFVETAGGSLKTNGSVIRCVKR